jgi:hypothetical protein
MGLVDPRYLGVRPRRSSGEHYQCAVASGIAPHPPERRCIPSPRPTTNLRAKAATEATPVTGLLARHPPAFGRRSQRRRSTASAPRSYCRYSALRSARNGQTLFRQRTPNRPLTSHAFAPYRRGESAPIPSEKYGETVCVAGLGVARSESARYVCTQSRLR